MRILLAMLNAVCLAVLLLALSIQTPAFGMWFYRWQFERNNTHAVIGIDEEGLEYVARRVVDFIRGRDDDLRDVRAVVRGEERLFFNELEAMHMDDVRVLFDYGLLGRNVAAAGFAVTLILLLIMKKFSWMLKIWRNMAVNALGLIAVLGILFAINFNRAFTIFHEIFFVDNWSFDPRTNLMVNMLPTAFWQNATAFLIGMYVALLVLIIVVTSILRRIMPKNG